MIIKGNLSYRPHVARVLSAARGAPPTRGSRELVPALAVPEVAAAEREIATTTTQPSRFTRDDEGSYFAWKWGSQIHYVARGDNGPPLLLLPGFGVGWFHYSKNIDELSKTHRVYALDLLGQGRSWPTKDMDSGELLQYSTDNWCHMIHDFIQEVIGEPTWIAGNSLGGYLAVQTAYQTGSLVRGIVLLNATPFWGFQPHAKQRKGLWSFLGPKLWDGSVPAPVLLKSTIEQLWWDRLRTPETIKSMLQLVYVNKEAASCGVMVQGIINPTEHPLALEAFASIAFSPKTEVEFHEMARRIDVPVMMLYGKEDPWVVPLWGQRLKRIFGPRADYFEVSPAGHCPHHEAPDVVSSAIGEWIGRVEKEGAGVIGHMGEVGNPVWTLNGVSVTLTDGKPRSIFEFIVDLIDGVRAV